MGLAVISQRHSLPHNVQTDILQQPSFRICNQSILNYLLIELRNNKDLVKFWDTVKALTQFPALKELMDKYRVQFGMFNTILECGIHLLAIWKPQAHTYVRL